MPSNLVKKLREDVKVTIQPALTGMSHVNVVSTGQSNLPLEPGKQPIIGVETSFFDPIIEQVGLGPVERNDIRHIIGEARQTVDSVAPRLRQILATLQETSSNLHGMSEAIRPAVASTVGQVEDLTRRINLNAPKFEATLTHIEGLTGQVHGLLGDNRENVRQSLSSVRDLTASLHDVVSKDRVKVERLLDGMDSMRARSERVLYQADQVSGQIGNILARSGADIQRSITNVRDATDYANKLAQKIFTNPFVLSPFYKPSHEDLRMQTVYDATLVFTHGAQELRDAIKTLETMSARQTTAQQQQDVQQLQQSIRVLANQLNESSQRLADSLKPAGRERVRR